jgi:hypothetical protein
MQEENRNISKSSEKMIDRLFRYMDIKGLSPSAYEKRLGLSNGYLKKQLNAKGSIGGDVLEKILYDDPSLNPMWLLMGSGNMILRRGLDGTYQQDLNAHLNAHLNAQSLISGKMEPHLEPQMEPQSDSLAESKGVYSKLPSVQDLPIITINENSDQTGAFCFMIDAKAAAGWPGQAASPEWYQSLPQFRVPWFYKGEFIVIQVSGDSMEPTLSHNDWVMAKRIFDVDEIREGYVHLVLLPDGPVVKRVYARLEQGFVSLMSDNKSYKTVVLPLGELLHIYKVEMFFSTSLGPPENAINVQIQRIDNAIGEMQKDLQKLKRAIPK